MFDWDKFDIIYCKNLKFECEIGFHEYEKGVKQKLAIDLKVAVTPWSAQNQDNQQGVQVDYYKVNNDLLNLLHSKRFTLLEAVADGVAFHVLEHYPVVAVEVCVKKFPLDMLNADYVSYQCLRKR